MKARRVVTYQGQLRRGRRGPKLWAYGYADLARLLGTTEGALRARAARGTFMPHDLVAVCLAWAKAKNKRASEAAKTGGVPAAMNECVPGSTIFVMPSYVEKLSSPCGVMVSGHPRLRCSKESDHAGPCDFRPDRHA